MSFWYSKIILNSKNSYKFMKLIIAEELKKGIFLSQITLFKAIYFLKHAQFFKVKLCEREIKVRVDFLSCVVECLI